MKFNAQQLRFIGICALVGVTIAAAIAFLKPSGAGTIVRLLVVPRSEVAGAAHGVRVLTEVVESSDFFTKVTAQDPQIPWTDFGDTDAARRARWHKTVGAAADEKTGILTLTVHHRDRDLAGRIAQAAADVLVRRGGEYLVGSPQVMLLDPPL